MQTNTAIAQKTTIVVVVVWATWPKRQRFVTTTAFCSTYAAWVPAQSGIVFGLA
jgi:hypothetical protein